MACDHSAAHSGLARYLRGTSQLQLVLVCDGCGAERRQLGLIDYRLEPRRLVVQAAELIVEHVDCLLHPFLGVEKDFITGHGQ